MTIGDFVEQLLTHGPGQRDANLKGLLKAVSTPGQKIEIAECDLKGRFDASSGSWPRLVKDIVAMANSGGGVLVLGVDDDGTRRGLAKSLLHELDPARINAKIEPKAPGARVTVSYHELSYYKRLYGFLIVAPHDALIVFDREWTYSREPGKPDKTVIYEGVVYVRGVAETRPARQGDLARIVQRLIDTGSQQFLARIEKLAAVPLNAELVAYDPATGGQGVRLVSKGEGHPVRIVDQAPGAVPIHEVLDPEVPFSSTQAEFTSQIRLWRTSDPNHRVQRETLAGWYLNREGLDVTDEMAEFAFLSAGDNHGFIMYWARAMSTERLDAVLKRELARCSYPMRQVLPYVVGAFRWSMKRGLLEPHLPKLEGSRPVAERVINARSFERFKVHARYPSNLIRFAGTEYSMESLTGEPAQAREMFESMLSADREGKLNNRGPAHQLDILLHASNE